MKLLIGMLSFRSRGPDVKPRLKKWMAAETGQ
jgi:hypothetical protein